MPNIVTKTFDQLVSDQVAAAQSSAQQNGLITPLQSLATTIGSVLRALFESNAAVALWFQGVLLKLLTATRAATSTGADLDSWAADFNFYRIAGATATGAVTFSRTSGVSAPAAFIPVGTQIQTSDASPEIFSVTASQTRAFPGWNTAKNGWDLYAGVASISVPVTCTTIGSSGNVLANQCNMLTGSIPGIDSVTNPSAFTNGLDAESDAAFRARFTSYLSSLSKANKSAIYAAVAGVKPGLSFTITENVDYRTGAMRPGYFFVVVDDGTVAPPVLTVNNAVDAVRAFTVAFEVQPAIWVPATVVMSVASSNATNASDAALANTAISSYIAGLGVGASLPFSKLTQLAYDASPTITNVTGITLNGLTADLAASSKQRIVVGSITVN